MANITYLLTYVRTHEGKSIGPPKFLGEVQKGKEHNDNYSLAFKVYPYQ